MKETGGLVGEFSLANVAPGLVFTFKVRPLTAHFHPHPLIIDARAARCDVTCLSPIYMYTNTNVP